VANNSSQIKRNRQNEKLNQRNSQAKSTLRSSKKRVLKTIESKETPEVGVLQGLLKSFIKTIDTAAQKGLVHRNTAARQKSRMTKRINSLTQQQ
jgi:small subunit ribosomal protein S20